MSKAYHSRIFSRAPSRCVLAEQDGEVHFRARLQETHLSTQSQDRQWKGCLTSTSDQLAPQHQRLSMLSRPGSCGHRHHARRLPSECIRKGCAATANPAFNSGQSITPYPLAGTAPILPVLNAASSDRSLEINGAYQSEIPCVGALWPCWEEPNAGHINSTSSWIELGCESCYNRSLRSGRPALGHRVHGCVRQVLTDQEAPSIWTRSNGGRQRTLSMSAQAAGIPRLQLAPRC